MPSVGSCGDGLLNCFTAMKPLRLAADANVVLNEADGVDDVVDALEFFAQRFPESDWLAALTALFLAMPKQPK